MAEPGEHTCAAGSLRQALILGFVFGSPARDGAPLEIGVLDLNGEDPVVIHAMRLRPKFYPLIGQG